MPEGRTIRARDLDLYELLQVNPHASAEVIQAAYRALARGCHPDLNEGRDVTGRMRKLNAAYATLSDPARRAAYDARTRAERGNHTRRLHARQRPLPVEPPPAASPVERQSVPFRDRAATRTRGALVATATFFAVVVVALAITLWALNDDVEDHATSTFFWAPPAGPAGAQPYLNPR